MRRVLAAAAFVAALVCAVPAAADLRASRACARDFDQALPCTGSVRRDFGDLQIPRVRAGEIAIPRGHESGRVTVIARLSLPPLAARGERHLYDGVARAKLNVRSAASRAYLARISTQQQAAVARLRREIPSARVSRRFRILLNGVAVSVPTKRLPQLVKMRGVTKVFPSVRYTLALNDSPSVIGARALAETTGARGDGMKIAVVDDGVDAGNPFFNPTGFQYPEGYPRGGRKWTTPKVIVARAFPGPGSGKRGRWAFDPRASFHGTHVAGIAAGNAGTTAPPGRDHPRVEGLSGVAPRAWIGNYRVFNVPTPLGNVANTPEILAAFESAVADDMDVINFSGGGPQTDPANDPSYEVIANVAASGVVPVISAGNDRDEFGLGSSGSPGNVPEAISVAATSNAQVFSPVLRVVAPGAPASLGAIPFNPGRSQTPAAWASSDQALVDVGTIVSPAGTPVDRRVCGTGGNVETGPNPLPPGSLRGAIALVSRGTCTFASKARRVAAAGAVGMIVVDNRPGEPNPIPLRLAVPAGMISDLDGARLRELMASSGGRTLIRVGRNPERIETGRSGIVTSFSSGGPTAFGHDLKPDVSAPGGSILSSTLPSLVGSPFAVFDGTSMAAPHVAGAAALLLQRHRWWSTEQVKSALVSTAGPAWGNTARTVEAPVVIEGGGLVDVVRADDPKVFIQPVSLSFDDLKVNRGGRSEARLVRVTDAGDGAGTWVVELSAQSATSGATVRLPPAITIPPGGEADLPVAVGAAADAIAGDNFGFIVLRRGDVTRRLPYYFAVTRPGLESAPVAKLKQFQRGDTLNGPSRANLYRFPTSPFGPPPDYTSGPPMQQDGAEDLYTTLLSEPAVNIGAVVISQSPGALIDPWWLRAPDENEVEGYAGTPVNVNSLTFGYRADVGAAGASFPRPKRYYVSVDSGRDPFTGRRLAGRYALLSWVNDVSPPVVSPVTRTVAAGRPTLVLTVFDPFLRRRAASGVDPLSLAIGYQRVLVGAAFYDPSSGIAIFPLPPQAPRLRAGTTAGIAIASDHQEAKNLNTPGGAILPNTTFRGIRLNVVKRPVVTWIGPGGGCVEKRERLVVVASATRPIRSVTFFDGKKRIAVVRRGTAGLYFADWRTARAKKGTHVLRAVVTDRAGAKAAATQRVRVCR